MTIPFHRSYLRSRLKKIWAFAYLTMLALPCAYFGLAVTIIVWLTFASTYGALMLLTRCPKCGGPVLGDGAGVPLMRVPEKCPFCGHPVEPDPETRIQAETAPPSH